ncbi:MAG TPA: M28 family peptidase [Ignavibacteriaceae bacterium]|nr:M28 family peptidase [Ignavibacteriaceae bacterium]
MRKNLLSYVLLLALLAGCSSTNNLTTGSRANLINKDNIRLNLSFLASDELEGRETTTHGEQLAALYIKTQLQRNGVKPFFGDTSFLQPFNVDVSSFDKNSYFSFTDNTTKKFTFPDDFFIDSRNSSNEVNLTAKVIFAGYGITAPEYKYDDYAGLDMKGKIVLVMDGEPSGRDSTFFNGDKPSKYSNAREKIQIAKKHGAAGIITTISKQYEAKWDFIKRFFERPSYSIAEKKDEKDGNFLSLYVKSSVLKDLLDGQIYSYDNLSAKAEKGETLPYFDLNGDLKAEVKKNSTTKVAKNIVGVIEGNDPVLKNEYVAVGAHYDHLGIQNGKVYNGADDDGSGTVTVMEVAKAFAKSRNNKRSILIVFHTGEEKGLLGSSYLTNNLDLIKQNKVVAQVNIDMVGRESADSIYSIGSDKLSSEMKKVVEEADAETVKMALDYKYDDPNDPNRFYYRSDHYNYAKHGIPIVFFFDDMRKDYHRDTDEVDKINFEKLRKIATLVYSVAGKIANLNHRLVVDKPID